VAPPPAGMYGNRRSFVAIAHSPCCDAVVP
jgi:hypothetical protein